MKANEIVPFIIFAPVAAIYLSVCYRIVRRIVRTGIRDFFETHID